MFLFHVLRTSQEQNFNTSITQILIYFVTLWSLNIDMMNNTEDIFLYIFHSDIFVYND